MIFAFLFPGQGSQSVGMLKDLSRQYSQVRKTFDEGSEIISTNLWKLINNGPEEELNLTVNTQPAVFLSSLAMWRIWNEQTDYLPDFMCGHSLGEFSALACSGAIEVSDALTLIHKRARLMQNAVHENEGAMAAIIGLDGNTVVKICNKVNGVVEAANFNSHDQTVISGHRYAVYDVMKNATKAGAHKVVQLTVSVPSHCSLMQDVAEEFAEDLKKIKFKKPSIPILHNVDASIKEKVSEIKTALSMQLYSPVQWYKTIKNLGSEGIEAIVEAGTSRVLSGLVRRIDKSITTLSLKDCASLDKAQAVVDDYDV